MPGRRRRLVIFDPITKPVVDLIAKRSDDGAEPVGRCFKQELWSGRLAADPQGHAGGVSVLWVNIYLTPFDRT